MDHSLPLRSGDLVRFNSLYAPKPGSPGHQRIGDIMLVVRERRADGKLPIVILLGRGELFPAMVGELEKVQ